MMGVVRGIDGGTIMWGILYVMVAEKTANPKGICLCKQGR